MNESAPHLENNQAEPLIGLAALARMAFRGADLGPLRSRLLERAKRDDSDANALIDLSTVLHFKGERECALSVQALALDIQRVFRLRGSGYPGGIRLLAFVSPGDLTENNALEFLVEGSDITLEMLYVTPGMPLPATLPEHDLAIVAVSETDGNRALLRHLEDLVESWPRPVLCAPGRIARLSRDGACALLEGAAGIAMPVTARIERRKLAVWEGGFPAIVRPVGSQKGHGLVKLDRSDAIPRYLAERPENEFYISRFIDYSGADGLFRKYRVVLIDDRPYVCHMAISDRWMVHYKSSGMLTSSEKRSEEEEFFKSFDDGFASRHREALLHIAKRLELEYVGIDCAETREGELLIFEVDSAMTVHAMDPVDIFPYKQPQMRKVFSAFRDLLMGRSHVTA
jgi:glutathione synthase/RimK-type ligase-like ATP-grasp enzyme